MKRFVGILAFVFLFLLSYGQDQLQISGNFEINSQTYKPDSIINAPNVAEKLLSNIYGQIYISYKHFRAGLRYEAYQNALLGYDRRYNGKGIANRFVSYESQFLTLTLGNFYDQFGNGLVLRAFEDRALGYDNAFDGAHLKLKPVKGIQIKALIGRQRFFWSYGPGIVRAVDGEMNFNQLLDIKTGPELTMGGSFVSRYQPDENPIYKLPENVAAWAGRINVNYKGFALNFEQAYKINDPSADNMYIYKPGLATYMSVSYSKTGFGLVFTANRYDNFSFRSDRNATSNNLFINSVPTIVPIHAYSLETIYPYAVHPTNEMGGSAEIFVKFKRKSFLGGKYGTLLSLDFVHVRSIQKTPTFDGTGYTSRFFMPGKTVFYQEIGAKLEKKISRKIKLKAKYLNLRYNKDIVQGLVGYGTIYANIGILDLTYRFTYTKALRTELQMLHTKQDMGSWAMIFAEYSVSPHWYFTVYDQYNYGNPHVEKRVHYYDLSVTYVHEGSRISIGYGRHREGIICVGGVCRNMPASNGFTFSVSTTF